MEHDARSQLEAEGVRMRDWSRGDHKTTCPKCSHERRKKRDPCLSVTIDEEGAVFLCHHCSWTGGLRNGKAKLPSDGVRVTKRPSASRRTKAPPSIEAKPLGVAALRFFESRRIGGDVLDRYGIRQTLTRMPSIDGKTLAIVFPFFIGGELVSRKYRAVAEKSFRQDKDTKRALFGGDIVRDYWKRTGRKTLVVCEGEMDVLALAEARIPAVTPPDGAGNGTRRLEAFDNAPWTREAERVILAGDRDEAGLKMRRTLLDRFGKERCHAVFWPTSFDVVCKDAGDALRVHGPEVVRECVAEAWSCADGPVGRVWQEEPSDV